MTVRLPAALAEIAAQAPGLRLPPDLWERGRRRRRVRFWRRLPAALLALVSAWLLLSAPAGQVGSGDGIALPLSFAEPHLWQQTLDGDTNGPILLRFTAGHSLSGDTADVYIGRDGSYRIDYLNPGQDGGSLSADGRYMIGPDIWDLATGQHRPLDRLVRADWTWSADGKTAIGAVDHDDPVISYGPDGRQLNDPAKPAELVRIDTATGHVTTITSADIETTLRLPIAVAPDGSAFATVTGRYRKPRVLVVVDTRTGVTRFSRTLPDDVSIAGPAAWAPDGRILLLAGCGWEDETCVAPWRTRSVDAVTGKESAEPYTAADGRPSVLGWRSGRPFMAVQHLSSCTFMVGNDPVPLAVPRVRCPEIPRTVAEEASLGGPPLAPSFWAAQWWFYLLVFGVPLGLVSLAWLWRMKKRRTRRAALARN